MSLADIRAMQKQKFKELHIPCVLGACVVCQTRHLNPESPKLLVSRFVSGFELQKDVRNCRVLGWRR